MIRRSFLPVFWLVATLLAGSSASAERLTVFAAASLGTALDAIAAAFEADTGHDVAVSLAGSSALARQIARGAPADIFLSASPDWMDALEAEGRLAPGTRADLLTNRLVLIAPAGGAAPDRAEGDPPEFGLTASDLHARLDGGRLAMALVDAVPAGQYGRAALAHHGLWPDIAPHVAQADNVRAALALVATGAAPLGIVYVTDAQAEPRVEVVAIFLEASHPPILYPVAALGPEPGAPAAAFLAYLGSPPARDVFAAQGFGFPGE